MGTGQGGGMKLIELTKGAFAQVDDADFDWLNQWKWSLSGDYAQRKVGPRGQQTSIYMHILIVPGAPEVDHRDNNGLNNQRSNLRAATHAQNMRNRRLGLNNKSGHRGVFWDKNREKWRAEISADGEARYLGRYENISDAVTAYEIAAVSLHGEFARLW
jgi:hypothetical protein